MELGTLARRCCLASAVAVLGLVAQAGAAQAWTGGGGPRTLLVGTYKGIPGDYATIQAAVDAASPGDTILVAPGDYKTDAAKVRAPAGANGADRAPSAVLITKPNLHVVGLDRAGVVVDGTKSGPTCSSAQADQNLGPGGSGLNGVIVYKASGVSVENLTTCNFLSGSLGGGNGVWFDGGAATGQQFPMSFLGGFLTATTTYYGGPGAPAGTYGLYSSNTAVGPGVFTNGYASNQNDSGIYVGACPDCNVALTGMRMEYNALGYSGTNSGGHVLITASEFANNQDGFDTNSQNNDDAPSPQDGSCPGPLPPAYFPPGAQQKHSCWVFTNNYVHDNNNPNVPGAGVAGSAPVGTGMSISGGRNDIVAGNVFAHNGAWGVLLVPYLDPEMPPPEATDCRGGFKTTVFGIPLCYYDDWGNELANNVFKGNGFFGNPSNGDIAVISNPSPTGNCQHGNVDLGGPLTVDPANLNTTCGRPGQGEDLNSALAQQVLCNTQLFGPCPPGGGNYPRQTQVVIHPLPALPSKPAPCTGLPANRWCVKT